MSKDPFQILADELTLIRHDMARLQRTSLDKEEAEALSELIVGATDRMGALIMDAAREVGNGAKRNRDQIAQNTEQAAARAAQKAVESLREHLDAERLHFAQSAGEARRAAWRSFGGFWVWLVSVGATGAFLGLLTAYVTETAESLLSIEQEVRIGCGRSWGVGQVVEQDDGSSFCAQWLVTPDEAARRQAREEGS